MGTDDAVVMSPWVPSPGISVAADCPRHPGDWLPRALAFTLARLAETIVMLPRQAVLWEDALVFTGFI